MVSERRRGNMPREGQSRLHQTPEAESVVHTHYTATMRALVGLMLVYSK